MNYTAKVFILLFYGWSAQLFASPQWYKIKDEFLSKYTDPLPQGTALLAGQLRWFAENPKDKMLLEGQGEDQQDFYFNDDDQANFIIIANIKTKERTLLWPLNVVTPETQRIERILKTHSEPLGEPIVTDLEYGPSRSFTPTGSDDLKPSQKNIQIPTSPRPTPPPPTGTQKPITTVVPGDPALLRQLQNHLLLISAIPGPLKP